jgi:hypothetical protein
VATKLLEHIPRLEPVMQILSGVKATDAELATLGDGPIGVGARVLALAVDFDALAAQNQSTVAALGLMRARADHYGPAIVEQLGALLGASRENIDVQEVALQSVVPGLTILEDVRNQFGVLLVPKGFEVSRSFLERLNNFTPELLKLRVRVKLTAPKPSSERAAAA